MLLDQLLSEENPGGPLGCFDVDQRSVAIVDVAFGSVKVPLEACNFTGGLKTELSQNQIIQQKIKFQENTS